MAHIHANGDEEQRPRSDEEIAAIEEQMRIAAKSCWRHGDRRKVQQEPTISVLGQPLYKRFVTDWTEVETAQGKILVCDALIWACDERKTQNRQIVSTFERDMLMGGIDA